MCGRKICLKPNCFMQDYFHLKSALFFCSSTFQLFCQESGVTLATFNHSGKNPSLKERLKIWHNWFPIECSTVFKIFNGILLGPLALVLLYCFYDFFFWIRSYMTYIITKTCQIVLVRFKDIIYFWLNIMCNRTKK